MIEKHSDDARVDAEQLDEMIGSCLGCHAGAASFRAVAAHRDPDLQEALVNHTMSCTGTCHPAAHPEAALTGGEAAS